MKILNDLSIVKNKKGEWWFNFANQSKDWIEAKDYDIKVLAYRLYKIQCARRYTQLAKDTASKVYYDQLLQNVYNVKTEETKEKTVVNEPSQEEIATSVCERLINFFSEFSFEPNFRFINTLTRTDKPKIYVCNYFNLTDNSYTMNIREKMKSVEFNNILTDIKKLTITKQINKRFKLYYGSQGTGKTTQAMLEADNNVMVCHSAMLPSDLMEDFKFNDGKAEFTPSALCKAMTEGKTIVLDEINLLPFESLRFLQSILDGKSQIIYKGQTINIVDGFKIIGTMNLQVNGITYSLPEPLVDRAEELRQFKLTADDLVSAII